MRRICCLLSAISVAILMLEGCARPSQSTLAPPPPTADSALLPTSTSKANRGSDAPADSHTEAYRDQDAAPR